MAKTKPNANATKSEEQVQSEAKAPGRELTFICKICSQSRPLEEMRIASAFFPHLIVCPKCEKGLR